MAFVIYRLVLKEERTETVEGGLGWLQGEKGISFSEDCKRYLSTQLHCWHRKHCLWNILLFVSTFSRGYTFFSQLSHTSVQLAWISCVDFRLEESKMSGEQKSAGWEVCDGLMRKRDEHVHVIVITFSKEIFDKKNSKGRLSLIDETERT